MQQSGCTRQQKLLQVLFGSRHVLVQSGQSNVWLVDGHAYAAEWMRHATNTISKCHEEQCMFAPKKYNCKTEATMAILTGMFSVLFHHYTTHLRRPSLRSFLDAWHAGPSSVSTRTPPFSQPAQELAPAVFWELSPRLIHYPTNPATYQLTGQTTRKRRTRWASFFTIFFIFKPSPSCVTF